MINEGDGGWWTIKEDGFTAPLARQQTQYEQELFSAILPFIKPHQIALDIGANIGIHAKAYCETGADVYAFEPNPEAFYCLQHNCPTAHCYNMALGQDPGYTQVFVPQDCSEGAFILTPGNKGEKNVQAKALPTIRIDTLDRFYSKYHLDNLSYMKIDVEGSEPLVICGGIDTIDRYRPVIVVEVSYNTLHRFGFTEMDIFSPLRALRYEIKELPHPNRHDQAFLYDALCLPG